MDIHFVMGLMNGMFSVMGFGIVDEMYDTWDGHTYRLRVVRYDDTLYWHKMVDGGLVEFKVLR